MKVNNYLNAVLETAETLSAIYRKSGDSENAISCYQAWDTVAEKLRIFVSDDSNVKVFDAIMKYILFGEESEASNNLISLRMLQEHNDQPLLPREAIKEVVYCLGRYNYGLSKDNEYAMSMVGEEGVNLTMEELVAEEKQMIVIADYLNEIDKRAEEAEYIMKEMRGIM